MDHDSEPTRHLVFVIRIEHGRHGLRGQVAAVGSGASRLFSDLADAVTFIRAAIDDRETKSTGPPDADKRPRRADEVGDG
jgi:hypothetical protein